MAIKINGTTVIDDSRSLVNINSITFADTTIQTTAATGSSAGLETIHARGDLIHKLDNPNIYGTAANDRFGHYVAMDGNYLIVSAVNEDEVNGLNSGVAYIFNVKTGELLHTLNNPNAYDTPVSDGFGRTVSISGNYAIVTASGEDSSGGTSSGIAYVYSVITGTLIHTLFNPNNYNTTASDSFGWRADMSGNYAIISATGEDSAAKTNSGVVYIFNVTTGELVHAIDNPDNGSSLGGTIGAAAAIDGNYAIVGNSTYSVDATNSGRAYIFNVATGELVRALDNPNAYGTADYDRFGSYAEIGGNYAIVGSAEEDYAGGNSTGKVYIFDIQTGALLHTLNNPNAYGTEANDQFGSGLRLSGNYLLVWGYAEDDAGGLNSGKCYLFDVRSGELLYTYDNPNAYQTSANDFFGDASISGNYAAIPSFGEQSPEGDIYSGIVHIFAVNDIQRITNASEIELPDGSSISSSNPLFDTSIAEFGLVQSFNNPNAAQTEIYDSFGSAVAVYGNRAVVGAWGEDETSTGQQSGKAYMFNISDGTLLRTLNNPNEYGTITDDRFGHAVAINDKYVAVGAPREDSGVSPQTSTGRVYIYDIASGDKITTLAGTYSNGNFGWSLAMSDKYLVVGQPYGLTTEDAAKVYVYNVSTGALVYTLDNPNTYGTFASDQFGYSVDISGSYVIVGAPFEDDAGGTQAGKAYVFDLLNGQLKFTLDNPSVDGNSRNDYFGWSVAITNNYALVSAYLEDGPDEDDSGKAYLYSMVDGQLVHTLDNPNAYGTSLNDRFGYDVSMRGNYALVSAYLEDGPPSSTSTGTIYVFDITTGLLIGTISHPAPAGGDQFGYCLAMDDTYIVAATPLKNTSSGAVYVFASKELSYLDRLIAVVS